MNMSEKDNPARKLHDILTKMVQQDGGYTHAALAKALGISPNPLNEFVEAALEVYALFDDVKASLLEVEGISEDLYVKPLDDLRRALPIENLNSP
jgi:hypothetical protein